MPNELPLAAVLLFLAVMTVWFVRHELREMRRRSFASAVELAVAELEDAPEKLAPWVAELESKLLPDPPQLAAAAEKLAGLKKLDLALDLARKAVERGGIDVSITVSALAAFQAAAKHDEVASLLSRVRAFRPLEMQEILSLEKAFTLLGRGGEAVEVLREALAPAPEHSTLLLRLGWRLMQLGRYEESIAPLRILATQARAMKATLGGAGGDPYTVDALVVEAVIKARLSGANTPDFPETQYERVLARCEKGAEARPDRAATYLARAGKVLLLMPSRVRPGSLPKEPQPVQHFLDRLAEERFRRALAIDPDHLTALLGLVEVAPTDEEAIALLERATAIRPETKALELLSELYEKKGDLQAAVRTSLRAHELFANRKGPCLRLMFLCDRLGKPEEAAHWRARAEEAR